MKHVNKYVNAQAFETIIVLQNKHLIQVYAIHSTVLKTIYFGIRVHENRILNLAFVEHLLVEIINMDEVTLKL